jgi:hypothetical protein
MADQTIVESLIGTIKNKDPQLYGVLTSIAKDLYDLYNQVNPPISGTTLNDGSTLEDIPQVQSFNVVAFSNSLRATWAQIDANVNLYEIRLGAVWATASVLLTTTSLSADFDPITLDIQTATSYTFQIAAKNSSGVYGPPAIYSISIPAIPAPVITGTLLSNFVLLSWTIPSSTFSIDHYIITRNGGTYGTSAGTFQAIFEVAAGTVTFTVTAVDIAGNLSAPSTSVTLTILAPIDYVQSASQSSTFTGTKVSCRLDIGSSISLLAPIDIVETYANHFIARGWASPQAQVTAGYPLYIEPSKNTATYTEIFDFLTVQTSVQINLDWAYSVIVGSVSINATIEVSLDSITWDTPAAGTTRFAAAMRYARVILTFVPLPVDKSLISIFNFRCSLSVHRENDGGNGTANATDVAGTVFTFNKTFRAIDSITVTPISTTACFPVVDFSYPINPTTFKVLLYDNAGVRITKPIQWDARGIV